MLAGAKALRSIDEAIAHGVEDGAHLGKCFDQFRLIVFRYIIHSSQC